MKSAVFTNTTKVSSINSIKDRQKLIAPEIDKNGLKINRLFTKIGINPLDEIEYEKRQSIITEPDGTIVFKFDEVEAPKDWSQLATDILASKYFKRAGVPGTGHELSAKQVVNRLANTLAVEGEQRGY